MSNKSNFVLAIYFPYPGKMDSPFSNKGYFESYQLFSKYCARRQVYIIIIRGSSYLGNMSFSAGWYFDKKGILQEVEGPFEVDLIMNKSGTKQTFDNEAKVLNFPFLESICSDKLKTYKHFASIMPLTVPFIPGHFKDVLAQINTAKIILKPTNGAAGRGILVVDRDQAIPSALGTKESYLAQAFIDTSKGIPGVIEGTHDIRLFIYNGVIGLAYTRTPKQGSLLANISLGGSMQPVDIHCLPNSLIEASKQIDMLFAHCKPRFYSADFMYENGTKPYLVELNSRPGFPSTDFAGDSYRKAYFDCLLEIIR